MNRHPVNAVRVVPLPGVGGLDTTIPRNARALRRSLDANVVIVDDTVALRRALLNPSVDVVRLRSGGDYRLRDDLLVNHAVTFEGAPGAVIQSYSTDLAPEVVVDAPAMGVVLRGLTLACPLSIWSRCEARDIQMTATYGTALHGALIDVAGSGAHRTGLNGCYSTDATAAIGVYADPNALGAHIVGCDFSLNATPYRLAAAGGHHCGPDANNGVVVFF